jgi:ribosomal protein L37AE/L43A
VKLADRLRQIARELEEEAQSKPCPDCRGKCVDRHGFDCVRCGAEGIVDE